MMVAAPTIGAIGDQGGYLGERGPADGCGLVGLGGADLVGAPREVQLVGAVGGAGHGLEGQDVLDGPGPVPGFFLDFAGSGGRAVFTWVDVAAGEFPDPPVDDEPVPPDQQHPLPGIVQHDGHRAPGQAHDVLVEGRAVGQLDGRDAQPDVRILVHDAVGVDRPACLLLAVCHSARLPALRCPVTGACAGREPARAWDAEVPPSGVPGAVSAQVRSALFRGVGGPGAGFRAGRVGAVCESIVARAARPRVGEGREGVRGNRGNPGFGGFPGFPWRLAVSLSGRFGAVFAAGAVHFPRSFARRGPSLFSGGGRRGLGKTWNRGRVFPGAGGGSGFSPVRFRIGLPFCLFTRVVEP